MLRARGVYAGALVVGGLALALASLRWPVVNDGPVSPIMSLLGVSLVADLVLMNLAQRGVVAPLSMGERVAGFFAGALVYLGARWLLIS